VFFDEFDSSSAWIRESAELRLPPTGRVRTLTLRGKFQPHPDARGLELSPPGLVARVDGVFAGEVQDLAPGPFELHFRLPPASAQHPSVISLALQGVGRTNFLAWLGRLTGLAGLQRYRAQNKNRQLRLTTLTDDEGEVIFDFSIRLAPYSVAYARKHAQLGINIAGFLTADLGVGESARCMVRAADAAGIPAALVPLKLHCKNRLGDQTYTTRLQDTNPHPVNIVHLDPPATHDLEYHHGKKFLTGKYNIGYWAWELPEFPDAWMPAFSYYHEIWCPSDFTRLAIEMKSPIPVIRMPHAISFERPVGNFRARFRLPADKFLFLFIYDLNSYSARKNPAAVIAAFRQSGLAGANAALVVKVQNVAGNEADFAALQAAVADLPGTVLIAETLSRAEIYQLESACDCFVSLHRAEGFGLAVAECMFLGKPVISTNWSATAEYVTADNGCPVDCQVVTLTQNHGPYMKGSVWAEADVDHAAAWMRKISAAPALAARLGVAARRTMEERFSPAVIGARYRQRLENIV
jgi:glycosyltransferase involved in cell wall biosynthesis